MLDNTFCTPCIISHFPLIPENMQFFLMTKILAKSKRMVNNQTSQYELFDLFSYLSCLGVFQDVRDILQLSLSLDHPVVLPSCHLSATLHSPLEDSVTIIELPRLVSLCLNVVLSVV